MSVAEANKIETGAETVEATEVPPLPAAASDEKADDLKAITIVEKKIFWVLFPAPPFPSQEFAASLQIDRSACIMWYQSLESNMRSGGYSPACDDDRRCPHPRQSRAHLERSMDFPSDARRKLGFRDICGFVDERSRTHTRRLPDCRERSIDSMELGFRLDVCRRRALRDHKGDDCSSPATIPGRSIVAVTQDWRRSRQVGQPARAGSLGSNDEVHWTAFSSHTPRSANHSRTYGNSYLRNEFDSCCFDGDTQIEEYLEWEQELEESFKYLGLSREEQVPFVVSKLVGRARLWWKLIKKARRLEGRSEIKSWRKMRRLLQAQFLALDYGREKEECIENVNKLDENKSFDNNIYENEVVDGELCDTSIDHMAIEVSYDQSVNYQAENTSSYSTQIDQISYEESIHRNTDLSQQLNEQISTNVSSSIQLKSNSSFQDHEFLIQNINEREMEIIWHDLYSHPLSLRWYNKMIPTIELCPWKLLKKLIPLTVDSTKNEKAVENISNWSWSELFIFLKQYQKYFQLSEYFRRNVFFLDVLRVEEVNSMAYTSSFRACSGIRIVKEGQQIHGHIVKSRFSSDLHVESALMDMYSKCIAIEDAIGVFNPCIEPDEAFLVVMLVCFAKIGLEGSTVAKYLLPEKCDEPYTSATDLPVICAPQDIHLRSTVSKSDGSVENVVVKQTVPDLKPEENDTIIYEFLVKWVGKSNTLNGWVAEDQLKLLAKRRLENYKAKYGTAIINICEDHWCKPQRIISLHESNAGEEALGKWSGLSYDNCTWEKLDDSVIQNSSHLISEIKQFETRALENDARNDIAKSGIQEIIFLPEQPKELQGGLLFPHQLEALNWLRRCWHKSKNVILVDEMGLGKTVSACSFISSLYVEFKNTPQHSNAEPMMQTLLPNLALWREEINVESHALRWEAWLGACGIHDDLRMGSFDEILHKKTGFEVLVGAHNQAFQSIFNEESSSRSFQTKNNTQRVQWKNLSYPHLASGNVQEGKVKKFDIHDSYDAMVLEMEEIFLDLGKVDRRHHDFFALYRQLKVLFTSTLGLILPCAWLNVDQHSKKFLVMFL